MIGKNAFTISMIAQLNVLIPFISSRGQPGGEAGGQTLRNSVNVLYEAMADMMRNFDLPEVAHDGADSEDTDDEHDDPRWD